MEHRENFPHGHTHKINGIGHAKSMIRWYYKKIPRHKPIIFLESLARITEDRKKRNKILEIIDAKESKSKDKYINVQKGGV